MSEMPAHRARLAATLRHHPDADTTEIRRDLRAAKLADYIRKVVDEAPPLTDAQRERLAAILSPAATSAGGRRAS